MTQRHSYLLPLLPLFTAAAVFASNPETHLSEIGSGYASTSVNTAVFRTASVASHDSVQYAAYYDPESYLTLASRRLGTDNWTVRRSQYKGNVADAHNIISFGIDGDSYIHVAFDHHGHPLHYAKSIAPGSLALGELTQMTGKDESDVTYPEFYPLAGGDLLFVYRSGFSGGGNMVMNRYDLEAQAWSRIHDILIDGEGERNAYWQLCTGEDGTIHVSWVWRETWLVETNHDLCYARSRDNGLTWERSDGKAYTLPITAATAEVVCSIPRKSELINQTSMSTDSDGNPMIATYWRSVSDSIPQYRLISFDGNAWHEEIVGRRKTPFSLSGGGTKMIPISRPRLAAADGEIYYIFRDAERGSKVSVAHRQGKDSVWHVSDLTDFSVDAWEPSYDTNLWKEKKELHIFVQRNSQGDGERSIDASPEPVYILELKQ